MPDADDCRRTLDAVWRLQSARILGGLMRRVRDVDAAEQAAQDAIVAALERWPREGIPDNPGAWLAAAARRRAIDRLRTERRAERHLEALHRESTERSDGARDADPADDGTGDDVLRLMFLCSHPVLPAEARTALTLRLVGGLTTLEIARAQLVPEPTVAQRIVRAKQTLAAQQVPFALPEHGGVTGRVATVLEVLYLMFNEGYAATNGTAWSRPELCEEATRLARVLAAQVPADAEAQGLLALLELQGSRLAARRGDMGDPILLLEQDRTTWDPAAIRRGLAALARAGAAGAQGPYTLQAEIAACHARAARAADTDWRHIVTLYGELARLLPSPVVELNRAVAVAMAYGPPAGLLLLDACAAEPTLRDYHLLPAVRGELLARLGRFAEATGELARALAATQNSAERALLQRRLAEAERRRDGGRR